MRPPGEKEDRKADEFDLQAMKSVEMRVESAEFRWGEGRD
jgi:hypothetical protein